MSGATHGPAKWAQFTKLLIAAIFSIGVPTASPAATIERHVDPVMGCAVKVSGQIVGGDSLRLRDLLEAIDPEWNRFSTFRGSGNHGYRICYDSPGGSFLESVQMAYVIQELGFGTAIQAGSVCESACAIAFMAGRQYEVGEEEWAGGETRLDRVLHPQGVLGFHAPSLVVSSGEYSSVEVTRAYAVALRSVSEILKLIEETQIVFPLPLLREMLSTPPDSMFRIERVEQALDWGILVAPTRFSGLPVQNAFETLCGTFYLSKPLDSIVQTKLEDTRTDQYDPRVTVTLEMDEGFGMEAAGPCVVEFSIPAEISRYIPEQMRGRFLGDFNLLSDLRSGTATPAFASYPSGTLLDTLPAPDYSLDFAFIESFRSFQERRPVVNACWLTSPTARVTNVNEYVNLRRQPDFSARVIRQVPLGEQVRPVRYDNLSVIGQERARQTCINACQAFGANSEDRSARDRVQQCIDDNMLWYEITDARGNRGWVSRKFLEEVE